MIQHTCPCSLLTESWSKGHCAIELLLWIFSHWCGLFPIMGGEGGEWGVDLVWLLDVQPATLSFPLLNRIGEENMMKSSWAEVRMGRSLTNYHHGQRRLNLGKINLFPIKNRVEERQTMAGLNPLSPTFFFTGSN